jgi:hypothetical protein
VAWIAASVLPAALSYLQPDLAAPGVFPETWLLPAAFSLAALQGLVLRRFVDAGVFWRWFRVTGPLVAFAPLIGYVAGVVALVVLGSVELGIAPTLGAPAGGWFLYAAVVIGLIGGGIPVVVAQHFALRERGGKRWLLTLPVPGLTWGVAVMWLTTDPAAAAQMALARMALAAAYGVLTAAALWPLVARRDDATRSAAAVG